MSKHRHETPIRRVTRDPDGKERVVWRARYTGPDGDRHYAKPAWNGRKATFTLKREAQRAIDEAHGLPVATDTVRGFHSVWRQPGHRSERTAHTNKQRIGYILGLAIEGRSLGDWKLGELRRRHVEDLVGRLFEEQGRAPQGVVNMVRALSVMFEDAISLEVADFNPTRGVRVSKNDRRAKKQAREVRVWSIEDMHSLCEGGLPKARLAMLERMREDGLRFGGATTDYSAMLRVFTDTGLRLGEVLALGRDAFNGTELHVRGNAHEGEITLGDTHEKRHVRDVPVAPTLASMLRNMPTRIGVGSDLLFATPRGRAWRERNFYRDVWYPAQKATGLDIRPHECRHSWVTHLRASGQMTDADLAEIAGHRVETMVSRYDHALRTTFNAPSEVFG